ncbi:fluoride efflux transporter CrcB [Coralliovum pocilloporae]|uniref:fluoride efflux transporter CrcB n=1 Tax=Coralliovum pocilloporae TaxID=3066369 RepID=UPI0033069FE1
MTHLLLVALGGAFGASLRYLSGVAALKLVGPGFPWGTVFVNAVGSLVMGVFIGLLALKFSDNTELRLFVATGLLGGFTTFSAFSLDAVTLWARGAMMEAALYVFGSVVVAIGFLVVGLLLSRQIFAP